LEGDFSKRPLKKQKQTKRKKKWGRDQGKRGGVEKV